MTMVTEPIPVPPSVPLSADTAAAGPAIPAIERIRLFSAAAWEEFVLEWVDFLRAKYERVERYGGAGDMGLDIVAHVNAGLWDNYQCKHYAQPLTPSVAWKEIGKFVFHCSRGEFTYPRAYYFVAPQGAGTTLSKLLKRPDALRAGLIEKWDATCRDSITSRHPVPLDGPLRSFIDASDFSIFEAVPPLRIIAAHAQTRWHVARFGGGLPERPPVPQPPDELAAGEAIFARELLAAYADHLNVPLSVPGDLEGSPHLSEHFKDSRVEFYSADSLRAFSRDTLPAGEFERLQDQIYSGIRDEIRTDHAHGYSRVLAVIRMARLLNLTDHALITRMSIRDRGGICHQLVNDELFRWVS